MQVSTPFDFDEVGVRQAYLMYHEELESLAKFNPEMERAFNIGAGLVAVVAGEILGAEGEPASVELKGEHRR